ncbi:MAG: hypothetical protein LBG07_10610 [Treponema sp.]|jgi:hypothetical protein|nr:hypothetical protein [Treponema sp.]
MKKYIAAVVILLGVNRLVSAELPKNGKWYFEVLGANETVNIEIDQNDWHFSMESGIQTRQTVTIDSDKKTIIIPLFTVLSDYFFYDEKDDYIDFFVGENVNVDLFDALKDPMAELRGINSITDEFAGKFVKEMEMMFLRTPILRLKKYTE